MNLGYHLKLGHTVQFSTHQEDRRGAMSLLFLMCFALALLALVMALDVAALYTIRGQMHSACESSVLAAALALTDDQQLIDDPHVRTHLIERARAEGRKYAVANNLITPAQHATSQIAAVDLFFEESSLLQGTPSSQPIPDLVQGVGYRRGSTGNGLHLVLPELFLFGPLDLSVRSMAQIDREIVGFRPQQSLNIPMVPMVVRSDPSGKDPLSWEALISGDIQDAYAFDGVEGRFHPNAGDGLPEITLTIQLNTIPLVCTVPTETSSQIVDGLDRPSLASLGGQILLAGPQARLKTMTSSEFTNQREHLLQSLEQVGGSGQARIWPLTIESTELGSPVEITGFMTARIVAVEFGSPTRIRVQPASLSSATAITRKELSSKQRGELGPVQLNPYVAKVRLLP